MFHSGFRAVVAVVVSLVLASAAAGQQIMGGQASSSVASKYDCRAIYLLDDTQPVACVGHFDQITDAYAEDTGTGTDLTIQCWTPAGGQLTRDTANSPPEGTASLKFDGTRGPDHLFAWDGGSGHDTSFPGIAGNGAFTIGFWIYPIQDTANHVSITHIHSNSSIPTPWKVDYIADNPNGHILFGVRDDTNTFRSLSTASGSLPTNTWTHVVARYNEANVHVFIDGVRDAATDTASSIMENTTDPELKIGWSSSSPAGYYIDEVFYCNGAFTNADVLAVRNGGL